jgi:hypothetical protein
MGVFLFLLIPLKNQKNSPYWLDGAPRAIDYKRRNVLPMNSS